MAAIDDTLSMNNGDADYGNNHMSHGQRSINIVTSDGGGDDDDDRSSSVGACVVVVAQVMVVVVVVVAEVVMVVETAVVPTCKCKILGMTQIGVVIEGGFLLILIVIMIVDCC